jgi:replicative DNA helicase
MRKLHDTDHENALLNCMFIDRSIIPDVARVVQESDFIDSFSQIVFRKIIELDKSGGADEIILNTETDWKNPVFIASLRDHVPTSANWDYYAKSVKRFSILRQALALAETINNSTSENIEQNLDEFLSKGAELLDVSGGASVKHIRDFIPATIDKIENAFKNKGKLAGIPTGFNSLDRIIDGYQNDFIILGARPSMGKTSILVGSALSIAKTGKNVGIISAEMSSEKILMRMLSSESGLDSRSIKSGMLRSNHFQKINDTMGNIYDYNVWIDDSSTKLTDTVASCRIMKRMKNCNIIFIDHAGMLVCDGDGVAEKGNKVSKTLKNLQKELGIPIVLLSQLRRDAEGKEPNLSDLRNSGSFEEDADVVMFLHRDRITNDENGGDVDQKKPQPAKIIVLKDRDGEIGEADVSFIPSIASFKDVDYNERH